jgi:hypothetical protein
MARFDAAEFLPEPARTKFRSIQAEGEARQAATLAVITRLEVVRGEVSLARAALAEWMRGYKRDSAHEARLQRAVDDAVAEFDRVSAERDARSALSSPLTALAQRLANYIASLPVGTKIAPHPVSISRRKEPAADIVARARKEIAAIKDQIAAIEIAPRPVDESISAAVAEIDELAQRGVIDVEGLVAGDTKLAWPETDLSVMARDAQGMPVAVHGSMIDVPAILAALFRDRLVQTVTASIREAAADDDAAAVPTAKRRPMIAKLHAQRLEWEFEEEAAVTAAAATGLAIDRRSDADPRSVLEIGGDLPTPRD